MKTAFLLLPLLFAGCISKQRCNRLFPPTIEREVTTTIIHRDSVIPGTTIYDTISFRDTVFMNTLKERIVVKQDTSGRAELRYWVDEARRLRIQCTAKDATVQWLERHVATNTVETRKEIPTWVWFVLIAAASWAVSSITLWIMKK